MTWVARRWWWLVLGLLAIVAGVVLITSVGVVGTCAGFGALPQGAPLPQDYGCQDELDAATRSWIVGSVALLSGLVVVAYGLGYRRGKQADVSAGHSEPVGS